MSRLNVAGLIALFAVLPVAAALAATKGDVPVTVTNPVVPVEVLNADPLPVSIESLGDNPARQAFARFYQGNRQSLSTAIRLLDVPLGKRAVLENLSCWMQHDFDTIFPDQAYLSYDLNRASNRMYFAFTRAGLAEYAGGARLTTWNLNQPIRAYADGATSVELRLSLSGGVNFANWACNLTGHFVDVG